jgi:hypothetical protein
MRPCDGFKYNDLKPWQKEQCIRHLHAGAEPSRGRACSRDPARFATVEAAIPPGAEVLVGNIMASADDVVDALRRHAACIERSRSK